MLGSPSREVILGIRRWWSGPRDGLVSSPVVVLQPASKFLPAFRLSLSLPCVRVVREPSGPRAVRLLFLYCQHLPPCIPRQSKLQSGKPFGGRGRSLRRRDTPPARRRLQGTRIDDARAALGELTLAPLRKSRQEILARKQFENGISKELQPLIVPGKKSRDSLFGACRAQLGDR